MTNQNQTPEREMDTLDAIMLIEGGEGDEEQMLAAWQLLHDTRIGYSLQGFYGRTLANLLSIGAINP